MWRTAKQQKEIMAALTDSPREGETEGTNKLDKIYDALTDVDADGKRTSKLDRLETIRDILIEIRDGQKQMFDLLSKGRRPNTP